MLDMTDIEKGVLLFDKNSGTVFRVTDRDTTFEGDEFFGEVSINALGSDHEEQVDAEQIARSLTAGEYCAIADDVVRDPADVLARMAMRETNQLSTQLGFGHGYDMKGVETIADLQAASYLYRHQD